jgi:hypothetical protein
LNSQKKKKAKVLIRATDRHGMSFQVSTAVKIFMVVYGYGAYGGWPSDPTSYGKPTVAPSRLDLIRILTH